MQVNSLNLFERLKTSVLNIDPVVFCEENLTLDGKPFKINGNGYKPFADVYRYIALKAIEPDSKSIVLVKGRQVGATTMAAALECYFVACGLYGTGNRHPIRIIHLFPTLALAAAYTKSKFEPIIYSSKPVPGAIKQNGLLRTFLENKLDRSSQSNDNMFYKKFLGNNEVWIDSTGPTGDRIRGRTGDVAIFDECQDTTETAIGAVTKVLTKSHYGSVGSGVQVYFGTPKSKGGHYYKKWVNSTQNYFHLKCESCEKLFPLYRPDVNWEDIWLYGFIVKCTHCGHEQDKRDAAEAGQWLPFNKSENAIMIGYHINQLYIPDFPKEFIIAQKPENSTTNTERIYMNEVLGEFYDGEGGTLTKQEILDNCLDKDRKFASYIDPQIKSKVYAGFDWGQKGALDAMVNRKAQGQSFSCGVVLIPEGPELFTIQFATRFLKVDLQSKMEEVEEMFRRYAISLAVGDIGDAKDLTELLHEKYGDQFLGSRAGSQVNNRITYNENVFPKEIRFEKDYYIDEVLGLLKKGAIRFPGGSYYQVDWLIDHCCSMEIKATLDRSGGGIKHFVKGSGPNDGLMALINAYIAWKFDVTGKFKTLNPAKMQHSAAKKEASIPAVLGYSNRW